MKAVLRAQDADPAPDGEAAPGGMPARAPLRWELATPGRSVAHPTDAAERPLLGVVVITRNEEQRIATCLAAVFRAVARYPGTRVVVVDSDSEDATVEVAATFPVDVYRYRGLRRSAAAGRRVGTAMLDARYLLFVDGDSEVVPEWLPAAIARLDRDEHVAVVHGRRRNIAEDVPPGFESTEAPEVVSLGGNALYRRAALEQVGGFNAWLKADEEGELLGRLVAAGFRAEADPGLMFLHRAVPRDTWAGQWRRFARGMLIGPGQVLRLAVGRGLLRYHVVRLNRYLATLGYLLAGVIAAVGGSTSFAIWAAAGALAFVALWWRRGRLRSATYIVTDWLLGGIGLVGGFLVGGGPSRPAPPVIERLRRTGEAQ